MGVDALRGRGKGALSADATVAIAFAWEAEGLWFEFGIGVVSLGASCWEACIVERQCRDLGGHFGFSRSFCGKGSSVGVTKMRAEMDD